MVESRIGPVDLPRMSLDERDVRSRRLEVEELLRVDLGEAGGAPGARQKAAGERRALSTVIPAAKRGDENGPSQTRPFDDPQLVGHFAPV